MGKKPKHGGPPHLVPIDLKERTEKAAREGRYQQALQLAKELYKRDPTAQHRELLQEVYLGRARQLRSQGHTRDAATVLQVAMQLNGRDPAWLERLAEELAACGQARQALELLGRVPDSQATAHVLAQAADAAIQQGEAGRRLLPEALHGDFDRVLRAFAQLEAGQDDQAGETLQGIGRQSPFLEWKLLARGLRAYYQNDDPRALENWQRLDPQRLPVRLAAPLRFLIDPAYRAAQSPEARAALQKQADRIQSSGLVVALQGAQKALAHNDLVQALRWADRLLPDLRQAAPHLVPRLAACFYWEIVHSGQPEDVSRYHRVFGAPAEDPQFARLRALVLEHLGESQEAHQNWQQFERGVAANPATWPGDQANRVRALVWSHMGQNAARVPDLSTITDLPPFLRDHPDRPQPLVPSAEQCFERSLELAPDQLEPYEALFDYYRRHHQDAAAEPIARRLLDRFPDHAATLEALGDLRMAHGDHTEALSLFQRGLKMNPLNRRLRDKLSTAHLFRARADAEAGRFDEARADYQAALALESRKDDASVYCKWAACEFKAGNPERAEELVQEALAKGDNRLAVAYGMVIEAIRLKLPRAIKRRFDQEFNAALAEPPSGAAAAAIAATAAGHHALEITYHGQKTHEKKVLAYIDKARKARFTVDQLEQLCAALLSMGSFKLLEKFTALGQKQFPADPCFFYIEAERYIAMGPSRCPLWRVQRLLETARSLVNQLPKNDRQETLRKAIEERQQMVGALDSMAGMFQGMFGPLLDDWDDDEDAWEVDPEEAFPFNARPKRR